MLIHSVNIIAVSGNILDGTIFYQVPGCNDKLPDLLGDNNNPGADIVIMLHPDYQYTPLLIPSMAHLIAGGLYHVVFGSRILGKGAILW